MDALGLFGRNADSRIPLVMRVRRCGWRHRKALRGIEVVDDRPHQILEGIRRRKVKANLGGLLAHSGADFEHTKLNRVEVGCRPLSAAHTDLLNRVQKHVGGAVQEEAKLICGEAMAGGPVGVQVGLVILDEAF